jgi:glycosyltransferase involved in cell wall biosynthesis
MSLSDADRPEQQPVQSRAPSPSYRVAAAPRVSIVMLTFNRPQLICRAIESIVAQSFSDWELIVVQDGNNQQILDIMAEWSAREPRIRHFNRQQGGNIANATNFAVARSEAEFIAVLDDDDYWPDSRKLEKQVGFLTEHPEYVCCGGAVQVIDGEGEAQFSYAKPEQHEAIVKNALFVNPIAHSSSMYRRSALLQVGGYDESLAGFQDWDVWLKFGQVGKLYNFPETFLCYTLWEGGGSFKDRKKNTRCSIAIVRRHRKDYRGGISALSLAYAYFLYARLPEVLTRPTFRFLSRMKKQLSSRQVAA